MFASSAMEVDEAPRVPTAPRIVVEQENYRECEQFQRRFHEARAGGQLQNRNRDLTPPARVPSPSISGLGNLTPSNQIQNQMIQNVMKMENSMNATETRMSRPSSTPASSPINSQSPAVSPVHMSANWPQQPPLVQVPAQDLLQVMSSNQMGLQSTGSQPPEGGVMVDPRSNVYHALVEHYRMNQRPATSQPDQVQPPAAQPPTLHQQPQRQRLQPQLVQQSLTQMMRQNQPQRFQTPEQVMQNINQMNNISEIARRIRESQEAQAQEQKFSETPEYQFKF